MTIQIQPEILERLRTAKRVVILSGAGLSAESGIPTFRDAKNSLWSNTDPMSVASIEGFRRNPEKVWAWHESMRNLFANAGPNAGHEAIAQLELLLQPAQVQIITQNIDGFHQEAGNTWVLEIHGTTCRIRCHRRCGYVAAWEGDAPHHCPICSGPVRPDVVWFGEGLDEMLFNLAEETSQAADVFIAVGTSGIVQPAASLTALAKNHGAMLIEVNPGKTPQSVFADFCINTSATEFFLALTKGVRKMRLRQVR